MKEWLKYWVWTLKCPQGPGKLSKCIKWAAYKIKENGGACVDIRDCLLYLNPFAYNLKQARYGSGQTKHICSLDVAVGLQIYDPLGQTNYDTSIL